MTTRTVRLSEWENAEPTRGSVLEGARLAGNPSAQRLAEALTKDGRVEVLELARGLRLGASSFVGRFALGDITVTIRPKIEGVPLMNLLRYAYRLRQLDLFTEVGYATSLWSFEDLLISQLAAETSELLARGLHRDYRRTQALLTSPRGRIDFGRYPEVAGRAGGALPCVYYARNEDTRLNQALHGGLELASTMTLDRELRGRVRRLAQSFASVITTKPLDGTGFDEVWHSLDRRTTAYRPALTLIGMLLKTHGASLNETPSPRAASGFLFDMNRFFQALLSRFLSENLAEGYKLQDEETVRGVFSYDPAHNPRHFRSPTLRPDFLVLRNKRIQAVLDAKYRDLWETPLPRAMLYQLALYALGQAGTERRAAILYPTLDYATRHQVILVRDPLRDTAVAQVILRPVNLLKLDRLLSDKAAHVQRDRSEFAKYLAFGESG